MRVPQRDVKARDLEMDSTLSAPGGKPPAGTASGEGGLFWELAKDKLEPTNTHG